MNNHPACQHCKWWVSTDMTFEDIHNSPDFGGDHEGLDKAGECHRYPPRENCKVQGYPVWAMTLESDWCGEFLLRDPSDPVIDQYNIVHRKESL
jgi:hypothetical protein